ncbi:MAG: Rrf2 family transcriptional regulator [bacterium]|jgi:Rrf2 family protein|nr:MAG: transcriptional regulator [bacterium]
MAVTSAFALAAHAVALLAFRGENGATSALIAASASTHPARVRRVLGMLVRAGIVSGREGAGGGYVLARSPDEITLAEVFDATRGEGSLLPLHPRPPNEKCPIGAGITATLVAVDEAMDEALRTVLAARTVSWLTRQALAAAMRGTDGEAPALTNVVSKD